MSATQAEMFDTDVKGEKINKEIKKKKGKLAMNEGASMGGSAAQNATATRRKCREKMHAMRVRRELDS